MAAPAPCPTPWPTPPANGLVERLLAEALRTERHPLIRFVPGAAGVREPTLVGTRFNVRQVMEQEREEGDRTAVAELLLVDIALIDAAMSYYAEFSHEVDADASWAAEVEEAERLRWQREQALHA